MFVSVYEICSMYLTLFWLPSHYYSMYIITVKELQKPSMKISGVLKSLIRRSANLESLNKTIFPASSA